MDDKVKLGISLTGDQILVVTEYLVKNFPDKSIKAVVVPGSIEVSIKPSPVVGNHCNHGSPTVSS